MVASIEKLFKILMLFSFERNTLSIAEIHAELKYPKSTIVRLLATLESMDFIKQDPDTRRYSLGFPFFRLGNIVMNDFDLRKVAKPIMAELVKDTGMTVDLNIRAGNSRVCIDKIDGPEIVINFIRIGEHTPLFTGASGKVLLAYSKDKDEILQKISEEADVNIEQLNKELNEILVKGYKITTGERRHGSFGIAVPIFDYSNEITANLTVAGQIHMLTEENKIFLVDKAKYCANLISERLGYRC
ncbi:IclR family transcriptional regulator [Bacillus salipaludis]|uniref:IclR family transcriptional regulator n=1 Tax=Bacillus salipaludis TaxID=2547811 RepID=UPI003D2405F6